MVQNQKHSIPFIFVVTIYQLYIYHLSIKCAFILYFAVRGLLVLKLRPQSNRYKVFGTKNKPKLCSTIWRSLKYISILIYIAAINNLRSRFYERAQFFLGATAILPRLAYSFFPPFHSFDAWCQIWCFFLCFSLSVQCVLVLKFQHGVIASVEFKSVK